MSDIWSHRSDSGLSNGPTARSGRVEFNLPRPVSLCTNGKIHTVSGCAHHKKFYQIQTLCVKNKKFKNYKIGNFSFLTQNFSSEKQEIKKSYTNQKSTWHGQKKKTKTKRSSKSKNKTKLKTKYSKQLQPKMKKKKIKRMVNEWKIVTSAVFLKEIFILDKMKYWKYCSTKYRDNH